MLKSNVTVGERIKRFRIFVRMTPAKVADKLGISVAAFYKMESGKTDISLSRMYQIAEVFQIWVGDLFSDDITVGPTKEMRIFYYKLKAADEEILKLKDKIASLTIQIEKAKQT